MHPILKLFAATTITLAFVSLSAVSYPAIDGDKGNGCICYHGGESCPCDGPAYL